MKMSIDEHIAQLKKLKSFHNGSYGASINFALDIMRKYQMIEEIYKNWCYPTYFNATDAMNKLGEVLKDGTTSN